MPVYFVQALALGLCVATVAAAQDLPNDRITPGAVASIDQAEVCGYVGGLSYSKRHRQTTAAMKRTVRWMYGNRGRFVGEIDHRIPLAIGGADTLENLWPEPAPGYRCKDRLEAFAWRAVCRSRSMPLSEAQAIFLTDWRIGFAKYIGDLDQCMAVEGRREHRR